MNHKLIIKGIAEAVIGGGGLVLVIIFGNWQIALGVLLILWGNNIGRRL